MTDVERKLWEVLRGGRLGGVKFKRQAPIGPSIADFVCHPAKLIIELDGSQHDEPENRIRDEARDRFLQSEGYRVLRFWNFEIQQEFEAVIDRIYVVLVEQGLNLDHSGIESTPLPVPLPQGERGRLNGDLALCVPSPLVGEGQGEGYAANSIDPFTPSSVSSL
jgi:adenine-specific DNA-methyltransferase